MRTILATCGALIMSLSFSTLLSAQSVKTTKSAEKTTTEVKSTVQKQEKESEMQEVASKSTTARDEANEIDRLANVHLLPGFRPAATSRLALLWDNGPFINSPGTGVGGKDESVLQTVSLDMGTFGFGHQAPPTDNRIADDLTVPDPAGWIVDSLVFYAYQTGSDTTSTIDSVSYQIWDGDPSDPASSVVFGDLTTNRLINTGWTNVYRVTETSTGTNTDRPIMRNTVSGGFSLAQGTYWIVWQTAGSLASGPWAPPITVNGVTTTGNALQYIGITMTWSPVTDVGQQGFPFLIYGTGTPPMQPDLALVSFLNLPGSVLPGTTVNFDVVVWNFRPVAGGGTLDIFFNGGFSSTHPIASLNQFESDTIAASVTASAAGSDTVLAALQAGDLNANNDTLSAVYLLPLTAPYWEDFDAAIVGTPGILPLGWTNETDDQHDWYVNTGTTPSTSTGPSGDHTSGAGNYMYTESSGLNNLTAHLTTPLIDISSLTTPGLIFWYHMYGADMGELHVDVNSGGVWTNDVMTPLIGQHQTSSSDPYLQAIVDLSAFGGVIQIRFRGITGPSFNSDMAIDDVHVDELPDIRDYAVDSLQVQACLVAGEMDTVKARVTNLGDSAQTDVPVELHENGVFAEGALISLNAGESTTLSFPYTPSDSGTVRLDVISLLAGDTNPSNDTATAYIRVLEPGLDIVFKDDFEDTTFTIANWMITNDGGTCVWMVISEPYPNDYTLPVTSSGNVFSSDADECGSGSTTLTTAIVSLDLSSYSTVRLDFDSDWLTLDSEDTARVNVSSDGGATWATVLEYAGVNARDEHVALDLTAELAMSADAWIAFQSVQPGWDWWWTIDNICVSGESVVGVEEPATGIPEKFELAQNYPNPFNPSTVIRYGVPTQSSVSLKIYNIIGQQIATLVNEVKSAGYFNIQWNGTNEFGSQVASGVYFYRVEAEAVDGSSTFRDFKKMLFVK